jgi:hypothetical protein
VLQQNHKIGLSRWFSFVNRYSLSAYWRQG